MVETTVVAWAARDNAQWCGLVCATHGLSGRTDADAWSVPRRSPPRYPDAVTLRPGVAAEALLDRIDPGPGASVKDSFADLDLRPYGFRVLFAAEWLHRPPTVDGPADAVPLTPVTGPDRLAAWAAAHGGGALFRPGLLADSRVSVLARYAPDGSVAGGAVLHDGGPVTGVSNVFAADVDAADVWAAVVAARPGTPLVGYESGPDLDPATGAGLTRVGPLRIWLRD
ncbi:hypothetical protein ACFOOK_17015 [Micromonospora krabiensis]|uniref:Uncharacterized protein n=1 Tax=Micromonospora krabiensis TaxID=307121 RepID=A0A1C3MZU6_9ACTN|nr:hypothetical protein [Micromonospora krabiensis]SBV25852.1 hypothetical protein GA0070620_1334 [Micromonospora krabiensis]